MGSAKQADNPLIHKPTRCHAISRVVDGGGEEISSMNAISVHLQLVSLWLPLSFTYFSHGSVSQFSLSFLFSFFSHSGSCNFLPPRLPSLRSPPTGATVLLVNATDLDASREFGQASLIYSLEGSTQFRLNSRSGLRRCMRLCAFVEMHIVAYFNVVSSLLLVFF